jgi:hypothetical protein
MRLFVAMSGNDVDGSTRPCLESLKICGESKVLSLLAETFALWSHNLQAIATRQPSPKSSNIIPTAPRHNLLAVLS